MKKLVLLQGAVLD